jgi:hypothetical protein
MLYPHVTYLGPAHPDDASHPATIGERQDRGWSHPRAGDAPGAPVLSLVGPRSGDASGSRRLVTTGSRWSARHAHGDWSAQDRRAA